MALRAGDIVKRRGTRRVGEVVLGRVPVVPVGYPDDVPPEHLCRVAWDGSTYSVIEDSRTLKVVDES